MYVKLFQQEEGVPHDVHQEEDRDTVEEVDLGRCAFYEVGLAWEHSEQDVGVDRDGGEGLVGGGRDGTMEGTLKLLEI